MTQSPIKNLLRRNLDALMQHHWGRVNKTRLATESQVGQGTYDRINEGTSVGIDVLEKISGTFKLEAWQLLAGELNPESPPETAPTNWPFPDIDRQRFDDLQPNQRIEIQGVVRDKINEFERINNSPGRSRPTPGYDHAYTGKRASAKKSTIKKHAA